MVPVNHMQNPKIVLNENGFRVLRSLTRQHLEAKASDLLRSFFKSRFFEHLPRAPRLAGHLSQRPVQRAHEVEEDRVDLF